MYSFPDLEPICCSVSSPNCCFLTCIQISQEAGQVVWYSHLLKDFPQFVVIHTIKGFDIVNKPEVDAFLDSRSIQIHHSFAPSWLKLKPVTFCGIIELSSGMWVRGLYNSPSPPFHTKISRNKSLTKLSWSNPWSCEKFQSHKGHHFLG